MPLDAAFAPYRLQPGSLPEEAARAAATVAAEPLVAAAEQPLPVAVVNRALADVPAGRASSVEDACRGADGNPSGTGVGGAPRACLTSDRHRARVAEQVRAALGAGFAGVCLDRPDLPLALGLLGAGFCAECQRDLARRLQREFGDQFQPVDYLRLARDAVAQASGAVGFDALPFGREFWRGRQEQLDRAVQAYARSARDASRATGRPFEVVGQFEALGPAQLRATRHLDAVIFPATLGGGAPGPAEPTGIGLARLLRAALGHRPCALALPATAPAAGLPRLAAVAATAGVEISGVEPGAAAGAELAAVRRLARGLAARGRAPSAVDPVAECAILYSAESDLWTGGRHRLSVKRAGEALAALHAQAPVVTRLADAPAQAAIVLADAGALAPAEAKEIVRRLEAGASVLTFGEAGLVDAAGRPDGRFLEGGKPGGVKEGHGLHAALPSLAPEKGLGEPLEPALVEKALAAMLGKGRRAASVVGRAPVLVVLHRGEESLDAHLVTLGSDRAQGTTLFLGLHVAGGVRRGRFVSADGQDVRIPMNPSGYSISTVLPSWSGYAVLSLPG
jgi:hypothetical protein